MKYQVNFTSLGNQEALTFRILRPVLLIIRANSDKNKSFSLQNKGITYCTKQELAYNSKRSNEAKKLPFYSDYGVDRSEKQICLKTFICIKKLVKTQFGYNFLLPCNFQFNLYNRSTL